MQNKHRNKPWVKEALDSAGTTNLSWGWIFLIFCITFLIYLRVHFSHLGELESGGKKTPGPSLFLDVANDVYSVPSYVCQPRPLLKRSVAALESSQRMRTQRACPTLVVSLMSYPQKTRGQR